MKKLMSFLIALLSIGLLISSSSCKGDETIDYAMSATVTFVNATSVKPLQMTFYRNGKSSTISFESDTTIYAHEIKQQSNFIFTPYNNDSITVNYGGTKEITYSSFAAFDEKIPNPCNPRSYIYESGDKNESIYSFTFTKDMLE